MRTLTVFTGRTKRQAEFLTELATTIGRLALPDMPSTYDLDTPIGKAIKAVTQIMGELSYDTPLSESDQTEEALRGRS